MEHHTNTPSTPAPDSASVLAPDPRDVIATAIRIGGGAVGAVLPEQMQLPTPCDAMDVRAMLGHLVAVVGRVAAVGSGVPVMSTPTIVTDVGDDEWADAWETAVQAMEAVWQDDSLLHETFVLPWATKSGVSLLLTYASEISTHTWDLAVATGQAPAWDEPTLEMAYETMRHELPGDGRGASFAAIRAQLPPHLRDVPPPFAEVVAVGPDASAIDRLVAWNGREPGWRP